MLPAIEYSVSRTDGGSAAVTPPTPPAAGAGACVGASEPGAPVDGVPAVGATLPAPPVDGVVPVSGDACATRVVPACACGLAADTVRTAAGALGLAMDGAAPPRTSRAATRVVPSVSIRVRESIVDSPFELS